MLSTEPIFTIDPPPATRMCGSTARDISHRPFTLMSKVWSKSSSLRDSAVPGSSTAALLTRTLICLNLSSVADTSFSTLPTLLTSALTAKQSPPISAAARSSFSLSRPAITTFAPSRTNAVAMALPIPLPPPVMIATLPLRRIMTFNGFRSLLYAFHIPSVLVQHHVRHFAFFVLHKFNLRIHQLKEKHGL